METIAERLQYALEMSDIRSIRSLHRTLEARGDKPGTYSTVHRYFVGEVEEPPLSFLRTAGEALHVSVAWLAFGEGQAQDGFPTLTVGVSAGGVSILTIDAGGVGRDLMVAIVQRLVEAQPNDAPEPTAKDQARLAKRLDETVGGLIRAVRPFDELPDLPWVPPRGASGTTAAILGALLAYMPADGEGFPVKDVIGLLPRLPEEG